jgi:hypothetical protein
MAEKNEYLFKIDGFTPLTLPMNRLVDYMKDLVSLFGNEKEVHFLRVEEGSATQRIAVDPPALPRVEKRLLAIRTKSATKHLNRCFRSINRRLIEDSTCADLISPTTKVIKFPGKKKDKQAEVGPIHEAVSIQGEIVELSGRDETVSVYIKEGTEVHICHTTRDTGKKLKPYLWEGKVRLSGLGTWTRTRESVWQLEDFQIDGFEPLRDDKLTEVVTALRAIEVPELEVTKPWQFLSKMSEEEADNGSGD